MPIEIGDVFWSVCHKASVLVIDIGKYETGTEYQCLMEYDNDDGDVDERKHYIKWIPEGIIGLEKYYTKIGHIDISLLRERH